MTRIALLIPTRNRQACLARSLLTVLPAARAAGAEVVICDQSVTACSAPSGVRVLHRPDLNGLPAARNALLRATTAEVVCFLDDDTDLAADFVVQLQHTVEREAELCGWGPVVETRPLAIRRLHRLVHLGCLRDPRRLQGLDGFRPAHRRMQLQRQRLTYRRGIRVAAHIGIVQHGDCRRAQCDRLQIRQ